MKPHVVAIMAAMMDFHLTQRGEDVFLKARGWIPLGAEAFTGLPGWGKMIEDRAVTVNEAEALAIEGWSTR